MLDYEVDTKTGRKEIEMVNLGNVKKRCNRR